MKLPVLNRNLNHFSLFAAITLLPWTLTIAAAAQISPDRSPIPLQFAVPRDHADAEPPATTMRQLALATSPFASPIRASGPAAGESSSLPEAPEPVGEAPQQGSSAHIAPLYRKDIWAGWQAQPLSPRDKMVLGLRDLYSLGNFGSMFVASGFSHLTNGQPNFGTDSGAYAQRLGAAALRETTEGLFTDVVFAPMLHQDPRYYVLGPQYGLVHRTLYAITRPLITRNDSGRQTFNSSLWLGNASASVLTNAYYPASNRNVHDTLATFGGSIGGSALGDVVSEFADQLLVAVHLRHPE